MKAIADFTSSFFMRNKTNTDHNYQFNSTFYDLSSLLNGFEQDHLTEYMYYGNTKQYNNLLTYNKNYYLYYDEINIIKNNLSSFKDIFRDIEHFVEIGPGSYNSMLSKTLPILKAMDSIKNYHALDISLNASREAARTISSNMDNVSTDFFEMNFYNLNKNLLEFNKPKCVLFLGSTIGNISNAKRAEVFHSFVNFLNKGDYLVMTFDVNHDIESLLLAYDNHYAKQLVLNSFFTIKNILQIDNFDLSALTTTCRWDKEDQSIKYFISSAKSQELYVNSLKLFMPKDKEFNLVSSKKFSEGEIQNLFKQRKIKYINHFKDNAKRMKIYVFKK